MFLSHAGGNRLGNGEGWEAAAKAAASAEVRVLRGRVALLEAERDRLNERRDYAERELNKSIDETARLRALVSEILQRIEEIGVIGSKNDEWRERAGLTS